MLRCPECDCEFYDALEWAGHVFSCSSQWKLPYAAIEYAHAMCKRFMGCGEVCITAFAHFAQAVCHLPCKDAAYRIDPEGQGWFDNNGKWKE